MSSEELLELLEKDVKDTEDYIKSKENISLKNYLASLLVKSGIGVKYALPFLVGALISIYINYNYLNNTIGIDKRKATSSNMITMTSTGEELFKKSYDISYKDNTIKHTTGWSIDDKGLYTRIETTYDFEVEENYMDINTIRTMSKEDIDNMFDVSNVEVIKKSVLTEEDKLYSKDMLIFNYSYVDSNDYIYKDETLSENFYNFLNVIFFAVMFDGLFRIVMIKTLDNKLTQKLEDLKVKYKVLSSEEYSELLRILNLKKENLKLVSDEVKVKKLGEKHE